MRLNINGKYFKINQQRMVNSAKLNNHYSISVQHTTSSIIKSTTACGTDLTSNNNYAVHNSCFPTGGFAHFYHNHIIGELMIDIIRKLNWISAAY